MSEFMKPRFAIDMLICGPLRGLRRLIALLTDGIVVRKILTHQGLETEPPPFPPARAPLGFPFAE